MHWETELYRKFLPVIELGLHVPNAPTRLGPSGRGIHILGASELPLRQGFAARNAWTPQSGGSLRSQERTGRSYKKFLPRLNSVCSLVSSPMV